MKLEATYSLIVHTREILNNAFWKILQAQTLTIDQGTSLKLVKKSLIILVHRAYYGMQQEPSLSTFGLNGTKGSSSTHSGHQIHSSGKYTGIWDTSLSYRSEIYRKSYCILFFYIQCNQSNDLHLMKILYFIKKIQAFCPYRAFRSVPTSIPQIQCQ